MSWVEVWMEFRILSLNSMIILHYLQWKIRTAPVKISNGSELNKLTVLKFTVNEVARKLERLRGGPDDDEYE